MNLKRWVVTLAAGATAVVGSAFAQVEKPDVHIAVGGKAAFYYLPLTIAEQLGYFKDEGLRIKISDFKGGLRGAARGGRRQRGCRFRSLRAYDQPAGKKAAFSGICPLGTLASDCARPDA